MPDDAPRFNGIKRITESIYRRYRTARLKRLKHDRIRYWRELRTFTHKDHTLQPFDQYQCIFVHVPKTGGCSVSNSLFGCGTGGHRTVTEYKQIFGETTFNSYFKFAFVRNPWDRVVSIYFFFKKGGPIAFQRWAQTQLGENCNFESFVRGCFMREDTYAHKFLLPQHKFLCDKTGTLMVDFLGRFENFEEDFKRVRERLGGLGSELKHINASKRGHYKDYYTDETRAIIAQAYRTDIALFGYEFKDSQPTHQARELVTNAANSP
jgi:hypothetical protein